MEGVFSSFANRDVWLKSLILHKNEGKSKGKGEAMGAQALSSPKAGIILSFVVSRAPILSQTLISDVFSHS